MKNARFESACAFGTLLVALASSHAFAISAPQSSVSAVSLVGALQSPSFGVIQLDGQSTDDGSLAVAGHNQTFSFSGMDGNGDPQTMQFSGETRSSADYGNLHVFTTGSVQNTYYNASNPAYLPPDATDVNPDGSPDGFVSLGFAFFSDTLQFGGNLQAGYQARYIFHVDGTNSGTGGLADLAVTIGNDPQEAFFAGDPGFVSTNWATVGHDINGTDPQMINVQFSTQFVMHTFDFADGSNVSGFSDFSSTLTLSQIQIVDANGNGVDGVTVSSASGTQYTVTPEPASLSLIIPGAMVLMRRRKRA